MSTTPTPGSPYSEDWISYRKLVLDTLKRLDERTMDMFQRVNDLTVGQAGHEKELGRIEALVKALETRVDGLDEDLDSAKETLAKRGGAASVLTWVVGVISSIVGAAGTILIDKFVP